MKFIKKFKGAKNAEVNLVEIEGKLWVHKKEDAKSSLNEIAFYKELKKNKLPSLQIFEDLDLPEDEIVVEYIESSPPVSDTIEDYELWGKTLKQLHGIKYPTATVLRDDGFINLDVDSEYSKEISKAKEIIVEGKYFSDGQSEQIAKYLTERLSKLELSYCLVHGDMHSANVLKRGNELVLFDKSPSQWSFTPLIDLAIVMLEVPNGYLVSTNLPEYQNDTALREAFLKGYGDVDLEEVRVFAQLEAVKRINNSHEPLNPEVVKTILK